MLKMYPSSFCECTTYNAEGYTCKNNRAAGGFLRSSPRLRVAHPSAASGRYSEGASKCRGRQMPRSTDDAGSCRAPQTVHVIRLLLRFPVCALPTERLRCSPTAATRSGRLTPPPAALPSLPGRHDTPSIIAGVHGRLIIAPTYSVEGAYKRDGEPVPYVKIDIF